MTEIPPPVKAVTDALTPYLVQQHDRKHADMNAAVLDMLASTEKVLVLWARLDPKIRQSALYEAMVNAVADVRKVITDG